MSKKEREDMILAALRHGPETPRGLYEIMRLDTLNDEALFEVVLGGLRRRGLIVYTDWQWHITDKGRQSNGRKDL